MLIPRSTLKCHASTSCLIEPVYGLPIDLKP